METLESNKESKDRSKYSKIWNYFTLLEKDNEQKIYTKCKVGDCSDKLLYHSSTSAIIKHLKAKRPEKYNEYEAAQGKYIDNQMTLTSSDFKLKDLSKEKVALITASIARFLANDMRPLSTIEGEGFRQLIRTLEPRYTIPARSTFSDQIIPSYYDKMKNSVIEESRLAEGFAFTFDYWTSLAKKGYLTLTVHFINDEFKLRNFILRTAEVKEAHTGDHTAEVILSILNEFKLQRTDILKLFAVSDSASNMKKTAKVLGWPRISCFAHVLHNSLSKRFDEGNAARLLTKSRTLIKYFRLSSKNTNVLIEMQNKLQITKLKLKLDVDTRWNSTYDMLERLLQNRTPIVNLALEKAEIDELNLTTFEWQETFEIKELLKPFKHITDLLCTSSFSSVSMILPLIYNIKERIQVNNDGESEIVSFLKTKIREDFSKHVKGYNKVESILSLASLLDPQFKSLNFADNKKKEEIYAFALEECRQYSIKCKDKTLSDVSEPDRPGIELGLKKLKLNDTVLSDIFGQQFQSTDGHTDNQTRIEREVKDYLLERNISFHDDPLDWWKTNEKRYKVLSLVAKHFLEIPATSVES